MDFSDRRNRGVVQKDPDLLDLMYVNRSNRDIVSTLRMRCCDKFLRWDGSGREGLHKKLERCPLCNAELDTRGGKSAEA